MDFIIIAIIKIIVMIIIYQMSKRKSNSFLQSKLCNARAGT